eukprot:CAMPEP_0203689188 /NCGR_PEP_ID=MMETSP0091-20130426/1579_1 /ASSEMBLY_ACC=CAM_ASM_001089 /TAXON_ID=426623 /ORGANISM="Chaetoceros affinis, Strain CCMP159" /LENGTH=30 /DNA_ID= /DNA_START= /DNA_END= /DNA_ORIENTATION=
MALIDAKLGLTDGMEFGVRLGTVFDCKDGM